MGVIREIVGKAKQNHLLVMLVCCFVPIAVMYAGVIYLGWSRSILLWGVLLLCPLSHILLMRGHGGHDHERHDKGDDAG